MTGICAMVGLLLAALVLVSNHRRSVNRAWALFLVLFAGWQGFLFAARNLPGNYLVYFRVAVLCGGGMLWSGWFLVGTISGRSRSVRDGFARARWLLPVFPAYLLVFTAWYYPWTKYSAGYHHGFVFWLVDCLSLALGASLIAHSIWLLRVGRVAGIGRSELKAFVIMLSFGTISFLATMVFRVILDYYRAAWVAPSILIAGQMLVTAMLIRSVILDFVDVRRACARFLLRAVSFGAITGLCAWLVLSLEPHGGFRTFICGVAVLVAGSIGLAIDWQLTRLVNRRFAPQEYLEAQSEAGRLVGKALEPVELYEGFERLLTRWSDGSRRVWLVDGSLDGDSRNRLFPAVLWSILDKRGWATPEILDRDRHAERTALNCLVDNNLGAVILFSAHDGGILAAFEVRGSQRPFVTRELREARELLGVMQLGLSAARMRRQFEGVERFKKYARNGPRFVHELRNGLHLNSVIMQAIVEGRGAEVLRDDARVGLDRIAQVNRLVERFFDVGEIQDAVPDRLDLRKLLEKVARGAKAWFGKLHHADIRLELSLPEGAATSGDRDLLEMALVNLLKNAAEAIAHGDYPRLIEIAGDAVAGAARIRIRDFGPGLPIDRLADPFSPGLSHKRNGSGLGLSIARDFIESMGGRIRLASSTHEGTCFEILLNLVP